MERASFQVERLGLLVDAARAFAAATGDYPRLLQTVAERVAEVLDCFCFIGLLSADECLVEPVAFFARDPAAMAALRDLVPSNPLPADEPRLPSTRVLATGQPLLVRDLDPRLVEARVRPEDLERALSFHPKSLLISPLRAHGKTFGLLTLVRHGKDTPPFDDADAAFAQSLADSAALAIANARLLDDATRMTERLHHDITSRLEGEQARALLASIVQSANVAIISVALDATITSWNRAAERVFGYSPEEAIGKSILMLAPPEQLEEQRAIRTRVFAGAQVDQYDALRRRKDGSDVFVSLSLSPILDASGKVIGASATARDMTDQRNAEEALRRTEEQLRQAQKMEAVGRLAGGVAHDFNNLLSVILSYGEMVRGDMRPDDPLRADVAEVCKAAARGAELTRQLLLFSRHQAVEARAVDLGHLLGGVEKMLRRIVGEDVTLTLAVASPLGRIRADTSSVEQVIMNLVVNARDAMPEGGRLTIEVRDVELDEEYARDHLGGSVGPHVMLAVTDTGVGMSRETQSHIFEPFFTTKERGKGTGLGLSTVFGIARQCGGSVAVDSELGKGSSFKVYFPRIEEAFDAPSASSPPPATMHGAETILLVDDQEQVGAVAGSILRRHGYDVIVAKSAGDALLMSEQHRGPIHLLLTDMVMPQISGAELAKRIAVQRPETKVLVMSGYTDQSVVPEAVLAGDMAFLQKPFTPESLARKVRDVLGPPAREPGASG